MKVFHGLFSVLLVMLFSMTASAQTSANGKYPAGNSEIVKTADAFGIVLRPFNSWDNDKVKSTLEQKLAGVSYNSKDKTEVFKFVYYSLILNDLNYSIAPEISVVQQLVKTSQKVLDGDAVKAILNGRTKQSNGSNVEDTKLLVQDIYNDLVSNF
ncbi:MAG: hypothetical protein J5I52_08610 [Saprospiraceae bacterium]|nr:hypothetical protein [Saprospiraceae bacterium]MCZ2338850.1 hypothetical protein [Chitinophagales bacterium]